MIQVSWQGWTPGIEADDPRTSWFGRLWSALVVAAIPAHVLVLLDAEDGAEPCPEPPPGRPR